MQNNHLRGSDVFWEGNWKFAAWEAVPMPKWSRIGSANAVGYKMENTIRNIRKNRINRTGNTWLPGWKKLVR